MSFTGTLSINAGVSDLDGTNLMKGAKNNGGFGRATNFLQVDRQLDSGDPIFVDGTQDTFNQMPVIIITNAGRLGEEHEIAAGPLARRAAVQKSRNSGGKSNKKRVQKATKKTAKKAAQVSTGKPSTKQPAKKKSASKKRAAKK